MFKVEALTLSEYFDSDPSRKPCLVWMDKLIRQTAPDLEQWFYKGSPPNEPGMRMKLIGYGSFFYSVSSGKKVKWPVVGLALQKNYISVYLSVTNPENNEPILNGYRNKLGALKYGGNNFSFVDPDQLNISELSRLFKAIVWAVKLDPDKALVYSKAQGSGI
jgi:hypothetical protein